MRGGGIVAVILIGGAAAALVVSRYNLTDSSRALPSSATEVQRHVPVPIVDEGEDFTRTPERVWDGDGPLWCKEGPRVRLAGVAAREMGETCLPHHPCPSASATSARDHLVDLVGRPTGTSPEGHILVEGAPLKCHSVGSAKGSRTGAWCETASGVDLNCAMVESGTTLKWDRYWGDHRCG